MTQQKCSEEDTIMKKILAGVLAAASMLSVSATAFATTTDKTVTKTGELTYDVAVTAPKIVLNLVMPAKMAASLNPYGAEIKMKTDGSVVSKNGIASVSYSITNKSQDYGVYIDATAITTVTTSDKTKWPVKKTGAATDGTKGADLALIVSSTESAAKLAPTTQPSADAAMTASADGVLMMDSTAVADKTKGTVAGQTSLKKWAYIKAATGDTDADAGVAYMAFCGQLAKSSTTSEVVWNEDDAINVNLVLKVTAGPKTYPAP